MYENWLWGWGGWSLPPSLTKTICENFRTFFPLNIIYFSQFFFNPSLTKVRYEKDLMETSVEACKQNLAKQVGFNLFK